jgi:serine/threonine protein kinase
VLRYGHIECVWPTPQDYNEAVQMPSLAFADVELQRCEPELNLLGLPKPVSGSFASVYQMRGEKGTRWAVRCFLRNVPNQEERYAAISDQLARNKLPCMVPFEFVPQGIRVNERWFPILKMQWVDGIPLIEWIERNLEDAAKLTALQSRLKETIESLASVGIAHGDLQHGNIFVSRDGRTVKLVDYDGLYVPALEAMGSAEIGHRHYQHPARNGSHFARSPHLA